MTERSKIVEAIPDYADDNAIKRLMETSWKPSSVDEVLAQMPDWTQRSNTEQYPIYVVPEQQNLKDQEYLELCVYLSGPVDMAEWFHWLDGTKKCDPRFYYAYRKYYDLNGNYLHRVKHQEHALHWANERIRKLWDKNGINLEDGPPPYTVQLSFKQKPRLKDIGVNSCDRIKSIKRMFVPPTYDYLKDYKNVMEWHVEGEDWTDKCDRVVKLPKDKIDEIVKNHRKEHKTIIPYGKARLPSESSGHYILNHDAYYDHEADEIYYYYDDERPGTQKWHKLKDEESYRKPYGRLTKTKSGYKITYYANKGTQQLYIQAGKDRVCEQLTKILQKQIEAGCQAMWRKTAKRITDLEIIDGDESPSKKQKTGQ